MRMTAVGFALCGVILAVAWGDCSALGQSGGADQELAKWGKAVDPNGACTFRASGGKATITVPAGTYDLWYGNGSANAPRLVQEVEGDFTVQVKVSADCFGPQKSDGGMGRAAGLLVFQSDDHYLRNERNCFIPKNGPKLCWMPPLYDRDKQRLTPWRSTHEDAFPGASTWLRIQRSGQTMITSHSQDGAAWTNAAAVPTDFSTKVQVGVIAINNSSGEFVAEFEHFRMDATR